MKNKVNVEEVRSGFQSRRSFLKISGVALAGTGLLLTGCSDDDDAGQSNEDRRPGVRNGVFDFGGDDLGILTFAYALEQLEADFYTKVVNHNNFGSTFNSDEQSVLVDLYRHEVIHREFFQAAINNALSGDSSRLLPDLQFEYASVNFGSRISVLNTAKALEDTGVSAYNGAGKYIANPEYLLLAGKIVSVEARHASIIRHLLNPGSADFAGDDIVTTGNGLDVVDKPSTVISKVDNLNFIQTPFTAQFLP